MTPAEEQIRAMYAALARGDVELFVNAIADDATLRIYGAAPHAGECSGKPAILALMQEAMAAMEESQTIEKYVSSGDDVVAFGQETITSKTTGKSATGPFAHHWIVRDGKIVEFEDFEVTGSDIWS